MDKIAVYTLFDDNYFEYGLTMVYSFFQNNKWFDGDFIIINDNKLCVLSKKNREKISKISSRIKFLNVSITQYFSLFKHQLEKVFSGNVKLLSCFYKLEIFKEGYDKVLWIDSDIVVLGGLRELFTDTILDGKLCCCLDYIPTAEPRLKTGNKDYFNGGIYRADKLLREKYSFDDLYNICSTVTVEQLSESDRTKFNGGGVEQDFFNYYFKDEDVLLLPSLVYNINAAFKSGSDSTDRVYHYYGGTWKVNAVNDLSKKYEWFYTPWHYYNKEANAFISKKRKMYFYLYMCKDFDVNPAILVHEMLLKHYVRLFDELNFIVAVNNQENIDETNKAIKWLNDVCGEKGYNLRIVDNIKIRESRVVLEDLVPMIEREDDSYVFFGHSKGITDVNMPYRNAVSVLRWVISMYYYSFEYLDEVFEKLQNNAMYGALLTEFKTGLNEKYGTHNHIYSGNFYWLNPSLVKKNLIFDEEGKDSWFPEGVCDRFLAENFPMLVNLESLTSHNNRKIDSSLYDAYHLQDESWPSLLSYYGDENVLFNIQNAILIKAKKMVEEKRAVAISGDVDIFVITHKNFETQRTNPIYKIVCAESDDVVSNKLKVIKVPETLANDGWSEWQKIYEIFKGNAGKLKKYVGICHYHRYINFGNDVNIVPNMDVLFNNADMCVCNLIEVPGLRNQYGNCHNIEDYDICGEIIKENYPEFLNSFIQASYSNSMIAGNVIILRREDFIEMCNFIFGVLFEYCKRVGIDATSNESFHERVKKNIDKYSKKHYIDDVEYKQQARIPAFLSERLLTVWVLKKSDKIRLFEMRED